MFNISSFLSKFSKKIQVLDLNNEEILDIINKKTQLKLLKDDFEIKNYIIYTKTSPAIKNKLFIFKENILEEINKNTKTKIVDIK